MIKVLSEAAKLSNESMNAIIDLAKLVVFKKKHIIYNKGEIAEKIYFIHQGVVMVHYLSDGKLIIDRFVKEGLFIGGQVSYMTQQPTNLVFETLEDSIMLEIDAKEYLQLCMDNHEIQTMHSILITKKFKLYSDMIVAFRALSVQDKYNKFQELYGDLINRISMKNIATFLGMTHETLSRIRSVQGKK